MLYFMYIRVQNYNADMVEQTNILLQYSMCYVTYSTVKKWSFWPTFLFVLETPLRLSC